jgi:hypothetical protein
MRKEEKVAKVDRGSKRKKSPFKQKSEGVHLRAELKLEAETIRTLQKLPELADFLGIRTKYDLHLPPRDEKRYYSCECPVYLVIG